MTRFKKLIEKFGFEKVLDASKTCNIFFSSELLNFHNIPLLEEFPEKKQVDVFLGRLNPPHIGHKKIISSMKNPIVILVKGEKSSQEKDRNPLPVEYQQELLKKMFPEIKIIIAKTGFLPAIFGNLRMNGMEPATIFSGSDRIAGYKSQIERANSKMPAESHFHVEFKETERVASATAVRNALKNGDFDEFKNLMPSELWGEFEKMREYLTESSIVRFKQYLEDIASAAQIEDKPRNLFDDSDISDEEYEDLEKECLSKNNQVFRNSSSFNEPEIRH